MSDSSLSNISTKPADFDPFSDGEIASTFPATDSQREIWASTLFGKNASCAYNESISLHFHGAINVDAFKQAVQNLVARHESLHANFSADGATYCVINNPEISITVTDLHNEDDSVKQTRLQQYRETDVSLPFDLVSGPLFRVHLLLLSENENYAIICAHHIICDGLSWAVLLPDLANLYQAAKANVNVSLPAAERYSDYIQYISNAEYKRTNQSDLKYWLKIFADHIPQLELPTDRQRPKLKTYRAGRIDYLFQPKMVKRLKKLGASNGATFVVTFMAAFKIFLYRLNGQEDVVLGMMAAGQSVTGFNNLVGHCVNLLPVRSSVQGSMSFEEYLKHLRSIVFDAFEHQSVSFGTILKHLAIPRDPSRVPLCPVTFNIDKAAIDYPFADLKVDFITNHRHFENFEIFLNAVEGEEDQLTLECTYNSDLFTDDTMQRRLEEFEHLVSQILEKPRLPINTLSLIPETEQSLLDSWNQTQSPDKTGQHIHQLIEEQSKKHADKTAVIYLDKHISYSELNTSANRFAHYLIKNGVQNGVLVGLAVERSEHMLFAILGILKAGAAYVPLDISYPVERINYMVENASLNCIVTQPQFDEYFSSAIKKLYIEDGHSQDKKQDKNPELAVQADQMAYVIYTSGSTGRPKGVEVTHSNVVNFLTSMEKQPGIQKDDILLAVTTLSFDIAVLELLLPLTVGATTVIAPREHSLDGELLIKSIEDNLVTMMQATPSTWRLLLDSGWTGSNTIKALCGGEAFPPELAKELLPKVASTWNMYGPTETTVWSTCHKVDLAEKTISIGKPISNTQIHILNNAHQTMPIGVQGELYIGGAGVTRGYLNNTSLTQDRYIEINNKRLYRTGDQAKIHSDGQIECLGRVDNQVKVRGFRIELGEIESVLIEDEAVKAVVVDAKNISENDKRLIAYMVANNGMQIDTAQTKLHCQAALPEYMVPQHFVLLDELPLTLNGKIDRKFLPVVTITGEETRDDIVEPVSDTEKKLAAIWRDVLKRDQVSMSDNFFNLGGHSLLANQIITRIRIELPVSIPLTYIFEYPTLRAMCDNLSSNETKALLPPSTNKKAIPFPARLSSSQKRLCFLQQLYPDSALFNQVGVWRINGSIDRETFKQAINSLVDRQLILKTRISSVDGSPVMVEKTSGNVLIEDDFTFSSESAKEQELLHHIEKKAEMPLDFDAGQFLKIQLIKLDIESYVVLVISHPIIWDGWSFDILLAELSALYLAIQKGETSTLQTLVINYMDYPDWHNNWMTSGVEKEQLSFWKNNLDGASTHINLPRDRQRPSLPTYQGNREPMFFKQDYVGKITDLAHKEGVTLYMVLLSAFYELLNQYSGQQDITLATQVQGRIRPEFENILGPFVNTVLLRNRGQESFSHRDMIQGVRKTCVEAFNHQDVPFEKVIEQIDLNLSEKNAPPYQIMFTFQDTTNRSDQFAGQKISQINHNVHTAYTDIIFWLKETGHGLFGGFDYSTELFDIETISQFHEDYLLILEDVISNPDKRIAARKPIISHLQKFSAHNDEREQQAKNKTVGQKVTTTVPRREDIDNALITIWQASLKIDFVEPYDNFFELGGNSLSSMQVLEEINKKIMVRVPPRLILMGTLQQISEHCYQQSNEQTSIAGEVTYNPSDETKNITAAKQVSPFRKILPWFSKIFHTSTNSDAGEREYEHEFSISNDKNLFRGVFENYANALDSAPDTKDTGYDHSEPAKMYKDRLDRIYPSDYPVIFWFAQAFKEGATSVIDFGGHIGVAYYAYQNYIRYPDALHWLVCDVEEVTLEGKRLTKRKQIETLTFTTDINHGDGKDIFFASGSLQYMEQSLAEMLNGFKEKPSHIIVNLLPVHDTDEYYTLQNIGFSFCPYHIFKDEKFITELINIGYEMVDHWKNLEKKCPIPFHDMFSLDHYSGYYFRLKG